MDRMPRLPRPEAGLRALAERAPQAEAIAASWIECVRPTLMQIYALRRRLATIAVAVQAVPDADVPTFRKAVEGYCPDSNSRGGQKAILCGDPCFVVRICDVFAIAIAHFADELKIN